MKYLLIILSLFYANSVNAQEMGAELKVNLEHKLGYFYYKDIGGLQAQLGASIIKNNFSIGLRAGLSYNSYLRPSFLSGHPSTAISHQFNYERFDYTQSAYFDAYGFANLNAELNKFAQYTFTLDVNYKILNTKAFGLKIHLSPSAIYRDEFILADAWLIDRWFTPSPSLKIEHYDYYYLTHANIRYWDAGLKPGLSLCKDYNNWEFSILIESAFYRYANPDLSILLGFNYKLIK